MKRKELENRNIEVKYNKNQTYPTLDLVSSLGLNGISGEAINITSGTVKGKSKFGGGYDNALSDLGSGKYRLWEFGLKLSYPLGNRAAKSKLAGKKLEVAQLLMDIKDLENKISMEVREAGSHELIAARVTILDDHGKYQILREKNKIIVFQTKDTKTN